MLELDWILEMAARDDPKNLTFVRGGETAATQSEILAAWASVLNGPALVQFMSGKWTEKAAEAGNRLRQGDRALAPRLTRGGKAIDAKRDS